MSEPNDSTRMAHAAADRFVSFASLRAAHNALLKRHRQQGNSPGILDEIETFIRTGQAAGAILDVEDDRWDSQSMLDYWSTLMYRAGRKPPEAALAEFDPTLAPEIPDELCPYVGLDAFQENGHNVFFGRDRLIREMIDLLGQERLLSAVGASGSGKSSLVRAGLLSALKAGVLSGSKKWTYYEHRLFGIWRGKATYSMLQVTTQAEVARENADVFLTEIKC